MAFLGYHEMRRIGAQGMRGLGECRTCAPSRPVARWVSGLGGLGEMPPPGFEDAARGILKTVASFVDYIIAGIDSHDRPTINSALTSLEYMDDGSSTGWTEGRASKNEALSVLRSLIGEADRAEPGWIDSYFGTPPKQVAAFRAGAQEISVRMRNRAGSTDFDKAALTTSELQARGVDPSTYKGAVITGADAALIDLSTSAWGAKVSQDETNARKAQCNFTTVLTGEQSWVQYFEGCWQIPWWGKYVAGVLVVASAYAAARGARGR